MLIVFLSRKYSFHPQNNSQPLFFERYYKTQKVRWKTGPEGSDVIFLSIRSAFSIQSMVFCHCSKIFFCLCSRLRLFADFPETSDGAADGDGGRGGVSPRATGDRLPATFAVPDSDDLSLERVLPAEGTRVSCVLRHLHLLDGFPQRRAVTRRVFPGDPDFLRAFRHFVLK